MTFRRSQTSLSSEKKQYEYCIKAHGDKNLLNEGQVCVLKKNAFTEKFFRSFLHLNVLKSRFFLICKNLP